MPKLRINDSDTGESLLNVVAVPEGFSFQTVYLPGLPNGDRDYISVIVSPADAAELRDFLYETGGSMPDPRLRALLVYLKDKHPNFTAIETFDRATEILQVIDDADRKFKTDLNIVPNIKNNL